MKGNTSLRTIEPLAMVRKHPLAATAGGLGVAIICGLMGTLIEGPMVGMVMTAVGAIIGAPGAAHLAEESAEAERPV